MGFLLNRKTKVKREQKPCIHQVELLEQSTVSAIAGSPIDGAQKSVGDQILQAPTASSTQENADFQCQVCRQEQLAARKYRVRLILGLFFPFALQALDTTIIASALPWIASDFNELSQMNWIISAFNLCSAIFIPFWGQLADIFGRTAAMELTLVTMMIGSALCTAAPLDAFPLLIFGRALQGLSVAGITVVTKTILADKVSLKENAKNTSFFSLFAGISYAIGPVIGGFLTNASWRWCFGINIPVAVAGALLVNLILRPVLLGAQVSRMQDQSTSSSGEATPVLRRFTMRMSAIDYGGQFLFLSGMALIILALTWGGASYSWSDSQVIIPLVLGILLLCGFICWEYLMVPGRFVARKFPLQKPTIPWELLAQRNMALLFYINFATGMAMIAVLYFVDIYFTLVKAYTPSQAGIQLLYYTPGIGAGVLTAMLMCNVWPRQTFLPLFLGSTIEATGISVLAWALNHGHTPTIYGMMGFTGMGTGLRFMPGSLHGIGFFPNSIASVIALTSFAVPFGGTLAMTIMGTVFNNKAGLASDSTDTTSQPHVSFSTFIQTISKLTPDVQAKIRDNAKKGVVWAFIAILPLMWLCVLAAGSLGNVNITRKRKIDQQGRADFSENVIEGSFLIAAITTQFGGADAKKEKGATTKNKRRTAPEQAQGRKRLDSPDGI